MEIMILTLFYVLLGSVILFHSWGFWRVYRASSDKFLLPRKGAMAGLTGWFRLCLILGVSISDNGFGVLAVFILWIYGILFAAVIGMILTFVFRKLFTYSNIGTNILFRGLTGSVIGILTGILIGIEGRQKMFTTITLTLLATASAIMARNETSDQFL